MLRRTGKYELQTRKRAPKSPRYKIRWGRIAVITAGILLLFLAIRFFPSFSTVAEEPAIEEEITVEYVLPRSASNKIGDPEVGYIPRDSLQPLNIEPIAFSYDGDVIDVTIPRDYRGETTIGQSCLVDYNNNRVLWSYHGNEEGQIASMTKMMLMFTAYALVDSGVISLFDTVDVSDEAPLMGGSQAYLDRGERYTVAQLMTAVAVCSANDAAYLLAQYIGDIDDSSGVYGGVRLMNYFGRRMGLRRTHFFNAHGLPPARSWYKNLGEGVAVQKYKKRDMIVAIEANRSTPIEMAKLGAAYCDYPRLLLYSNILRGDFWDADSSRVFGPYKMNNHFKPIRRADVDGIKTGYTSGAGFCVTASAERSGQRLIAVVFGAKSQEIRDKFIVQLFETAFDSLGIPLDTIPDDTTSTELES